MKAKKKKKKEDDAAVAEEIEKLQNSPGRKTVGFD